MTECGCKNYKVKMIVAKQVTDIIKSQIKQGTAQIGNMSDTQIVGPL